MKLCRSGQHQYEPISARPGCPECKRLSDAARYAGNAEPVKVRTATWKKANPEKLKGHNSTYYLANRKSEMARSSAWVRENPERAKRRAASWWQSNPDMRRVYGNSRRAKKRGNPGTEPVTRAHLKMLFDAQDGCCRYCCLPLGKDKHLDHRVPLSRGGAHAPDNVCWACPECNLRKSARTEQEFLAAA